MSWKRDFEARTGERVRAVEPVAGGDIASSFRVLLASGETCFVKHYPDAQSGQTEAEAQGLRWLAEPGAIHVAQVFAVGERWLALEWIEAGPPRSESMAQLGRGLARLHAAGAPRFGLDHDNWIGRLPQNNLGEADWPSFYIERRLRPLVRRARSEGLLEAETIREFDLLFTQIPEVAGVSEPPARLHGDLWSGNVLFDQAGEPWLIDPAAYGGHREVDLAMMKLFGGFHADVFTAYQETAELDAGADARVELYQLYPLLVHLILFGGGYRASVIAALRQSLR
jgi:fructosamine-3-kinase